MPFRISLSLLLKVLATAGVLLALFAEVGGGPVAIDRQLLRDDRITLRENPEMPGLLGRARARVSGGDLPAPLPVALTDACTVAADDIAIYVLNTGGQVVPIDANRHCRDGVFALAMAGPSSGLVPIDEVLGGNVWVMSRGFRLVGIDSASVWHAAMAVPPGTFLPWFFVALATRALGVGAGILAWTSLLEAQRIRPGVRRVAESYVVGRFWGIVTPGTLGLDAWRWLDMGRLTGRVVAPGVALVVERLLGLLVAVGTLCLALVMAEGAEGMGVPGAAAVGLVVVVVLLAAFLVGSRATGPQHPLREALTAYSADRGLLARAAVGTVLAQGSVVAMMAACAFALGVGHVDPIGLFAATAVMKLGSAVLPAGLVGGAAMVALLGGDVTPAQAFMMGQLGAWIEKVPLSVPGGILLLRDREGSSPRPVPVASPVSRKPMMEASG